MPTTVTGKAIASRNATTHGFFARDVVLPSLGEDPEGYRRLEAEWMAQLPPRTLLERHYVEKIAAASWRLRRLHRWQAQLFEDNSLAENDRLDRAMGHETAPPALADPEGRQIDTAVKTPGKAAPQLFARRVGDHVLEDTQTPERARREDAEDDGAATTEICNRRYQSRKATAWAVNVPLGKMFVAPLDACLNGICEMNCRFPNFGKETDAPKVKVRREDGQAQGEDGQAQDCENELSPFHRDTCRVAGRLDPDHRADAAREHVRRRLRRREHLPCPGVPPVMKPVANLALFVLPILPSRNGGRGGLLVSTLSDGCTCADTLSCRCNL